mgnify:CR=1 FL=1|jgi:hypothetical protein
MHARSDRLGERGVAAERVGSEVVLDVDDNLGCIATGAFLAHALHAFHCFCANQLRFFSPSSRFFLFGGFLPFSLPFDPDFFRFFDPLLPFA